MKIDKIDFRAYRWPRQQPLRNGRLTYEYSETCVVEVLTDDGASGIGLGVGLMRPGGERVLAALAELFADLLRGEDPLDNERLWEEMWQPKLLGRRGVETRVIGMIDIALWDLKAKAAGLPLHKLLGGYSSSVPCYIAGGYYQDGKDLQGLAEEMQGYVAAGVSAVKMKIGRLPVREDARRVAAVREAVGPDVRLLVDANGAYSTAEAVRMARAMEPYDIYWFEEPVGADNYAGHAVVARCSSIPVAAGENEYTRYGFRDLINTGGVGILNPDAEILGGMTEFLKVAALAQAHDLPIAPHGRQETHLPLVAALPNGLMVEYYQDVVDPLAAELIPGRAQVQDGRLVPDDRPGHGIVLDEKAAKPHRVL